MYGHIVVLGIFGCFVAGVEPPNTEQNEVMPEEISPITDPMLEPFSFPLFPLTYDVTSKFFINEKIIVFNTLETIYGISEQSSNSSICMIGRKDRVKLQRQILALTYGTMMAFSTAVDFRICTLILSVFEDSNNEEYEIIKQNCHLYFDEMYFVFHKFQKKMKGLCFRTVMAKQLGEQTIQNESKMEVVNAVLGLRLDFILDTDTLDKQKLDEKISNLVSWQTAPDVFINGNIYKTLFPSDSFVSSNYRTESETIERFCDYLHYLVEIHMDFDTRKNVFSYLIEQVLQDSRNYNTIWFWKIFGRLKYHTRLHMWRLLMKEFTVDSQAKKVHRISKAIDIMKKVRLIHFTILFKTLEEYEEEVLGSDLPEISRK